MTLGEEDTIHDSIFNLFNSAVSNVRLFHTE